MEIVVHKYAVASFRSGDRPKIPRGATFIHIAAIGAQPYVWARVDTEQDPYDRHLAWFMTGQRVPVDWKPVGSFIVPDALAPGVPFVGHIFDGGEVER